MKPSDDIKAMYKLYFGKDAQTTKEISQETGVSESVIRRHAKEMVESGEWKEVSVKRHKAIATAYIRLKK